MRRRSRTGSRFADTYVGCLSTAAIGVVGAVLVGVIFVIVVLVRG